MWTSTSLIAGLFRHVISHRIPEKGLAWGLQSPSATNYSHSGNLKKYFKMERMRKEINYLVDNVPARLPWFF